MIIRAAYLYEGWTQFQEFVTWNTVKRKQLVYVQPSRRSSIYICLTKNKALKRLAHYIKGTVLFSEYDQMIRTAKMEARQFLILNFKGIPLWAEHKTIFKGLGKIWLFLIKVTLCNSTLYSIWHTLTFRSLPTPAVNFRKLGGINSSHKADCRIPELMKF
jgi:hypothetical protein